MKQGQVRFGIMSGGPPRIAVNRKLRNEKPHARNRKLHAMEYRWRANRTLALQSSSNLHSSSCVQAKAPVLDECNCCFVIDLTVYMCCVIPKNSVHMCRSDVLLVWYGPVT